jgi:hypothetical protein
LQNLKDKIIIFHNEDYKPITYLRLSAEDYNRRVAAGLETVSTVVEMLAKDFYIPSVRGNKSITG